MRKIESTISLLGGALVGASVMYLLDPQAGRRRRRYLADQAGGYLETAGEKLHGVLDKASQRGRDIAHSLADTAQDYAGDAASKVTDYGNRVWRQVQDIGERVRGEAMGAPSARHDLPIPGGWTGVGCFALGATLMFLVDPIRGQSRRAWLAAKVSGIMRRTGGTLYRSGQNLANRASNAVAEFRGSAEPGASSGDSLNTATSQARQGAPQI